MLFNSGIFAVFLAIVLVVHWSLRSLRSRNLFLLGASYLFYGWWDWRFLVLLIASSTFDYAMGIAIHDTQIASRRKLYLFLSCGANVATLVFFKYFNFFSDNLRVASEAAGLHLSWPVLHVILPVGVSFYTMQAMTYTIDVYRRAMPPCPDYLDFLLFVAYFPQLVAGPISKARNLIPQLRAARRFDPALASQAIPYIAVGYVLKTVVADNLAVMITGALANVSAHSGLELSIVAYAATFEIYGDFAGYTYIALGVSMLFGIRLPQNFRSPFLAQSIKEFWTRWHISLMSWLREYVFLSIVRGRRSPMRIRLTILFMFLLSGLWHGASWMAITWGLLNGVAYFLPAPFSGDRVIGRFLNIALRLNLSVALWLIFRVRRVSDGIIVFQRIIMNFWPSPSNGGPDLAEIVHLWGWRIIMMGCVLTLEIVQRNAQDLPEIGRWRAPARYAFYAGLAVAYFYRGNFARIPFIYFQF